MKELARIAPPQGCEGAIADDALAGTAGGLLPQLEQQNLAGPAQYAPQRGVIESLGTKYTMVVTGL